MSRLVRAVGDLDDATIRAVLDAAAAYARGATPPPRPPGGAIGLLFLEASLRTRVGFAAAAARLGLQSVTVEAARSGPRSMPESWPHTLRTMAGYVDLLVARVSEPLIAERLLPGTTVPVLSGGDGGPDAEHPTQALIDLFTLHEMHGDVSLVRLAVVGDLRMRAVRSLLALLARNPPANLTLITEPALTDGFRLPATLAAVTDVRTLSDVGDVDVLYAAGIPHGAIDEAGRTALRITPQVLDRLPAGAAVLSPLPVIDEIDEAVIADPRMRAFQQSDRGLYVRMALLERFLASPTVR